MYMGTMGLMGPMGPHRAHAGGQPANSGRPTGGGGRKALCKTTKICMYMHTGDD